MTPGQVHNSYKKTLSHLGGGRLHSAFNVLFSLSQELNSTDYRLSLEEMQSHYSFLLQYFMDGADDPDRKVVYNNLISRLFAIAANLREELLARDSANFEFSQKRYFPHREQLTVSELKERLALSPKGAGDWELAQYEEARQFLFYAFWLKTDYDQGGFTELFHFIMDDSYENSVVKAHLVAALTLNLWRTFDEKKVLLLLDAAGSKSLEAAQRALVGLCFILAKYNPFLPYFPSVRNRLVLMVDKTSVLENLQNIIAQIIATSETDAITKKMQEEIFPELMKLRPLMEKGLTGDNPSAFDEWGELNPDWQEMIESSGASDMMQELADMEMSGADVYMSTFSMLKSFPFFGEFSNWFLPFDPHHSAVKDLFKDEDASLLSSFISSPAMCNSDRYSFCLSMLQMPEAQRGMMKGSFGEAAEQMEEMVKDEALLSPQVRAKTISKHYVQDLFRFFKLNSRRDDFGNMFKTSLLLHRTYLFDLLSYDDEVKQFIADFYFSKKMYGQALELFEEMESLPEQSAEFYQKMGYAYQQDSQLTKALAAYKKADLIKPDDFWTVRKIAFCSRLSGDIEVALKNYRHAEFIRPGNLSVQLNIVNCLAELNRYDEALSILTELNREQGDNPRLLRATMKSAFAAHNLAQAEYFAGLLIDQGDLSASDWVGAAMIAWVMRKNSVAKERFKQGLVLLDNDWERFVNIFNEEKKNLEENGLDKTEIALLLDAIAFS